MPLRALSSTGLSTGMLISLGYQRGNVTALMPQLAN